MNNFKIAISGGKGGVGKSMLASSLAILFNEERDLVAVDCDVDVPNLAVWLDEVEEWEQVEKISVSERPVIEESAEDNQQCVEQCRFNAFEIEEGELKLNSLLCEGCGACRYFCPAVKEMEPIESGTIKSKATEYGFPLVMGELIPGETGSGKIVTEVKKRAEKFDSGIQVIDSAPGTGCPVTAAVRDADFVVLVVEPTGSGLSDLRRVQQVVDYFNSEFGVVVNKYEVNEELSDKIESLNEDNFLGRISYDQKVIEAASQLTPVVETDSEVASQIEKIFNKIKGRIKL